MGPARNISSGHDAFTNAERGSFGSCNGAGECMRPDRAKESPGPSRLNYPCAQALFFSAPVRLDGGRTRAASPERREQMGNAARRRALTQFCSSKIIPMYEKLYARVLNSQ